MNRRVISAGVAAVVAAGVVLGSPGSAGAVGPGTDYCFGNGQSNTATDCEKVFTIP